MPLVRKGDYWKCRSCGRTLFLAALERTGSWVKNFPHNIGDCCNAQVFTEEQVRVLSVLRATAQESIISVLREWFDSEVQK